MQDSGKTEALFSPFLPLFFFLSHEPFPQRSSMVLSMILPNFSTCLVKIFLKTKSLLAKELHVCFSKQKTLEDNLP